MKWYHWAILAGAIALVAGGAKLRASKKPPLADADNPASPDYDNYNVGTGEEGEGSTFRPY